MTTDESKNLMRYKSLSDRLALCVDKPALYRQEMQKRWPNTKLYTEHELERQTHDYRSYSELAYYYHEVACFTYRLDHDISKFLDCEWKVPEYVLKMYYDAKETSAGALKAFFVPPEYVKMFHGLAGRNFDGARRLAQLILDTGVFEILKNRADCYFFGNVLMYVLTGSPQVWIMHEQLKKRKKSDGKAFAKIFEGLLNKNQTIAQEGIAYLVKALKRQSEWVDDHIGYLNTWALGMANLCRLHGVWGGAVEPQVPADLLIPQEEVDAVLRQWPELGRLPPKE